MTHRSRPAGAISYNQKSYPSIRAAADAYASSIDLDASCNDENDTPEFAARLTEEAYFEEDGEVPMILGDLEIGNSDVTVPIPVWREACLRAITRKTITEMIRLQKVGWPWGFIYPKLGLKGDPEKMKIVRILEEKAREYQDD